MATLDDAVQTQLRNIEKKYGKSVDVLAAEIRGRGPMKHGEIIALLKSELAMGHGDANAVAHKVLQADGAALAAEAAAKGEDPADTWYAGPKAALRPIHDKVLAAIAGFGTDIEHAPKKTYVSLRRKKQFAMVGPATAKLVEVGVNLKGVGDEGRLQVLPPGGMCTHRVRVATVDEVDAELLAWVRLAYDGAG